MPNKLLLTSFQTWLPHQTSNSSDDLLEIIQKQQTNLDFLFFLRKLPVNIELAASEVIKTIEIVNPTAIICCGMAETRNRLTVESNAVCGKNCIFTAVNLDKLVDNLTNTTVSHNAGKFVCEGLYYRILNYIQTTELHLPCVFVHIPIINRNNINTIQRDFTAIIRFIRFGEE